MEKLNLKEKLLYTALAIFTAGLFYGTLSNLNFSAYKFYESITKKNKVVRTGNLKDNKTLDGKIVELNNKKYLGKLNKGPFDYLTYSFISPPMNFDEPPMPYNSMEFYKSDLTNSENLVFLDAYRKYKNNNLEISVNDTSNAEFDARQDTLKMLIEKYNSN